MTRRILVTGAAGFIGATFAQYAHAQGATLGLLLRPTSPTLRLTRLLPAAQIFHGDLRNEASLSAALAAFKPDCIVHCASTLWVKPGQVDMGLHFEVNANGTLRLLEAIKGTNVRLIYTGSSSLYGEGVALEEDASIPKPNSVYAVSKLAVSNLIALYGKQGVNCCELRIFAPYGPLDSSNRLLQFVIGKALRGESLELTSGRQKRDWVYADDVADALWRGATNKVPPGSIINIGGGKSISVADTVRLVLRVLGRPETLAKFGARPDRSDEMYDNGASIIKAGQVLGWIPTTSLEAGVGRIAAFMRDNPELATKLT